MDGADSSPTDVKALLIAAFRLSIVETSSIPGDIPSLIRHAYSRQFGETVPSDRDLEISYSPIHAATISEVLADIPPLAPSAQVLLDRARSILTDGPPLSMNVELEDCEELPIALHTLLQGTVWACLMGGGANPDLADVLLQETKAASPHKKEMHEHISNALSPEAKCLWFICRKFFFTMNVAEKDGDSYRYNDSYGSYFHRIYMGRLFMLDTKHHTTLTRARMPRALEVNSDGPTHIARTPKGLWGWGQNEYSQLGSPQRWLGPTRLAFPACPKVAELEASLPSWEKHMMVTDVSIRSGIVMVLTPAGTVMAGACGRRYVGRGQSQGVFNTISTPAGFVPDHIINEGRTIILSMGDRQIISGDNDNGRLGLGHSDGMTGFEELPFSVDALIGSNLSFNVFLSGHQLLFAGKVPYSIAQSGLLPRAVPHDKVSSATPLQFPEGAKAVYCDDYRIVWVTEGKTLFCEDSSFEIPFEATAFSGICFRHPSDQWFFGVAQLSGGVAETVGCGPPSAKLVRSFTEVNIAPWKQG
ncbi:hypothetical protein J8273_8536 [Carpediemonas membranifera]|uniref:Uncharacterized protein n=1 Tax=Carpediemonas membranifera TaxID=201153 RepID=A0A8J6E0W6_9EUKA|nr:hypothetical protein J8273_8536 [Carpediemonas membranifera]|eukprot:KAG9389857.1 hypothetical protein J8273_8536 [Carpediemonas membranifera]